MNTGPKVALAGTLVMALAIGIELAYLHHRNNETGVLPQNAADTKPIDPDYLVFLRKERPDSLKDLRTLIGQKIWVAAGGQMDYYRDTGKHVDYAKPVGTLLGADPMVIKDVFEQVPPKSGRAVLRIAGGQRHVLLGFTLPASSDPNTEYAVAVGNYDEGSYNFFTDQIFYYDDPRVLYKHWGPEVWAHIDKHEAALGMTENQVMMALGQVMTFGGDTVGNRSVTYDNVGHPVIVQFENDKAVRITPE